MTEEAAATPQAAETKGKRGVGRTQGLGAVARTLQWDPGLPASGTRLPRGPGAQRRPPGAGTRSPRAGDSGPGCEAISGGADAVGHRKRMGRWRPWPSSHFAVSEGAAGRAELGCAELGAQLHGAGRRAERSGAPGRTRSGAQGRARSGAQSRAPAHVPSAAGRHRREAAAVGCGRRPGAAEEAAPFAVDMFLVFPFFSTTSAHQHMAPCSPKFP